jgi:hypothetical protein
MAYDCQFQRDYIEYKEKMNMDDANLYAEIVSVARELYERNGRREGRDLDNWLEAEIIVRARYASKGAHKSEVIESNNMKYTRDEIKRHKRVIVERVQKNALDSSYSKTINTSLGRVDRETTKRLEKESRIKRLLMLREIEKTYLTSPGLLQAELKMIEEELQKASVKMYQKKTRLSKIENEIVKLKIQIKNFDYRKRIAATISISSFIIFIGMLIWYFKPIAFLFGIIFLGLIVYSVFNFVNSRRLKSFVYKKNRENRKLIRDLEQLCEAELFCKNKHKQKVDVIEKQSKELETIAAQISEVKSSIAALEEKEKIHDDNMSIEEKRKYERRLFVKPIKYYLTDPHMEELKKMEFDGFFVDISEGGLGMTTDYPLMAGDILFFKDEIKVNSFAAKSSTVRWAREIVESRCRLGLEFAR